MKKLTKTSPYSDQQLVYNSTFDEYELKFDFVNADFSHNYRDTEILKQRIKHNSRVVYNYIYTHCHSSNIPFVQTLINKTEEGRKFILSVLITQMRADIESGYNDLGNTPAINVANGQILPREEIKRNLISVETEEKIMNSNQLYFGFNIMVSFAFPISLRYSLCL